MAGGANIRLYLSLNFLLMFSPLMSLIKETLRNFLLEYFSLTACSLWLSAR